jgi:adenylate cyclase
MPCALQMRQGLAELNNVWRSEGQPELAFGIGLHQGEAIVGDIGSVSMPRMEFTVIGDAVNTGARLESATKQYGVDLLISDAIYLQVADRFLCRSVDLSRPVGKTVPVPTYTVIGESGTTPPAGLAEYEQGISAYRKGDFTEAQQSFAKAAALGLNDKLTLIYQERVQQLLISPPESWDGVYVMTKK